ncbi:hypothetical protein [Haloquadratum walsbyi]|jgi:hypothetical protein|uniref:Uncharacterized protein n=1 Tax=Haloquadratum walsbyi J07HQW2 TaxID=1238425 RepID=U1NIS6_9EURY|nr:hypothetical protein [Haloquadratum walsbyi]ERG96823.1 MAG: hypothetical protein J07HQW2_03307 [Haloquadratum walsbyi J07HQW2]
MVELFATLAAGAVVILFGVGLIALSGGDFAVAGVTFLSASIVIYFRETRLIDDTGG